jgi:hypothetical protein
VDVFGLTIVLSKLCPEVGAYRSEDLAHPIKVVGVKDWMTVLGNEDQVRVKHENAVSTSTDFGTLRHDTDYSRRHG